MRVDLHVHTRCSPDSLTSLRSVERWMRRRQVDVVAITDHNAVVGALALRQQLSEAVIVGEEIATTRGEISGLFLEELIPAGLAPAETVARIRAQGGLVYLPHPCDRLRGLRLSGAELQELLVQADIVEVLNSRITWQADNQRAQTLAAEAHLLCGAGSDAHMGIEIGRAYVEMPPFAGATGFLAALAQGRVGGRLSWPVVHLGSRAAYLIRGSSKST
jgi:predicted metal-dependent phosphoesterase TrpH